MDYILLVKTENQKKIIAKQKLYKDVFIYVLDLRGKAPDKYKYARAMDFSHLNVMPDETWLENLLLLKHIETLEIPIEMMHALLPEHLPSNVTNIEISGEKAIDLIDQGVFLNIESIECIYGKLKIRNNDFPRLNRLAINIDGTKKQLKLLKEFTQLKVIEMGPIKDSSLINELSLENVEYLNLWSGSITDLASIKELPNLKKMRIKNLTKIINLDGINKFSELEEVDISYCSQLQDISALLGNTKLKVINIGSCSKLDKTNILETLKNDRFELNIWNIL